MSQTQHTSIGVKRLAVAVAFFVCGFILAVWIARIPAIKEHLGLNTGDFGLVLFGMPAGLVVSMPLTGMGISRFGSHRTVTWSSIGLCLSLPFLALASSGWWLALALFVFGFAHAAMDISMNAQAVEVEKQYRRPIMSNFHALFSLGGLVGAGLGAMAAGVGITPLSFFFAMLVMGIAAMLWAIPNLLHVPGTPGGQRFAWPKGVLVGLGLVLFCTGLGEGAVGDWSGVFMRQVMGSSEAVSALAFSAFSIAMVIGRLTGDALNHRFGPVALARGGGFLAALGYLIALLSPTPIPALIGFVLTGFGYCTLFPLVFSAAGSIPGVSPGMGLASVATLGYLGFLVGPPLIGLVSQATSLRVGFALTAGLAVVIILLAGLLRPQPSSKS